ncbi:hypothetical protein D3C81_1623090 [compost metagenome]
MQADAGNADFGNQGRRHIGIAQVHVSAPIGHHLQRFARGLGQHMDRLGIALLGDGREGEVAFSNQSQASQIRFACGTPILQPGHQRHRCFGILPGEDHAAGALGGQRDIHHDVHFTGTGGLQHLGPTGIAASGHLEPQPVGCLGQVVVGQPRRLAVLYALEGQPDVIVQSDRHCGMGFEPCTLLRG